MSLGGMVSAIGENKSARDTGGYGLPNLDRMDSVGICTIGYRQAITMPAESLMDSDGADLCCRWAEAD